MLQGQNGISWFYESASEKRNSNQYDSPSTFGVYQKEGTETIDERFERLYEQFKEENGIDIKTDIRAMLGDHAFMNQYKSALIEDTISDFREASENDPHIESIIKNVNDFWDTKVRLYSESASLAGFLPIATLEFPVLVKQFFRSIIKDIIEIETVKSPQITKHIRTTYLIDNQTGEEYEYPKCWWNGEWKKIWDASKGHKIREDVIPLTNGRLWKYDIITNLTDGTPGLDTLSFNFKIVGIQVGSDVIRLPGNGISIEFSTNGTLLNGDLDFEYNGTRINDTLGGRIDFRKALIDISSASGQVEGIVISGYLSNEKNLRHVSVREKREILRFTIGDGARYNMPFTMEEIEDAAALLDINYYNRMVDEIVKTQEMQETVTTIDFLNKKFEEFNGVTADIYKLESMALTFTVDINPPPGFAGDPILYINRIIQFKMKAMLHQMAETTKMDNLSWIIVGNPMATQLINDFITWKTEQGSTIGGISVNSSYGFATGLGANIRVVATNTYDAYTVDPVTDGPNPTNKRELVLHAYAYPTDNEHISFRHLVYTNHLFTSQNQTAYQSTAAPGGAYNIVTATSRFENMVVQGIQTQLIILNSENIYGPAPDRDPISGAPWPV